MRRTLALTILVLGVGALAAGCGGSDDDEQAAPETTETTMTDTGTTEPAPDLAAGLPEDIAGYVSWPKLNAAPIPPRDDGDAHFGTKEVYSSEEIGGDGLFPDRTIIVKDATRPDTDFVGLVAIMRKMSGSDPANNDWEFVEYTRGSADEPFSELASGTVCTSCHVDAADSDYVWTLELGLDQ